MGTQKNIDEERETSRLERIEAQAERSWGWWAKRIGAAIARNIWPVAAWLAILAWAWTSLVEMDFTYMLGALLAMILLAVDRVGDHLASLRALARASLELSVVWQKYEIGRHESEAVRRIVVKGTHDPDAVLAAFQEALSRKVDGDGPTT